MMETWNIRHRSCYQACHVLSPIEIDCLTGRDIGIIDMFSNTTVLELNPTGIQKETPLLLGALYAVCGIDGDTQRGNLKMT